MARWATLVQVAGVDFSGCRAKIVDGRGFLSSYAGSVDYANDNTAHAQVFNRGAYKGIPFGIQFVSTPSADLQSVIAAVQTAQASNATFRVKITDGIFVVDVMAIPDYNGDWVTFDLFSEGWYEGVLMRFISKAVGA